MIIKIKIKRRYVFWSDNSKANCGSAEEKRHTMGSPGINNTRSSCMNERSIHETVNRFVIEEEGPVHRMRFGLKKTPATNIAQIIRIP